jgi:hypothetical protein
MAGGMIGYVESMELEDILDDVNTNIRIASTSAWPISELELSSEGWKENGVTNLFHPEPIPRPFEVSPFTLRHLWVDLRNPIDE